MPTLEPKSPGFRNIKSLMRRIDADRRTEKDSLVSVEDKDVPAWQRQTVWNDDEMGLLAYSIIRHYPIGIVILWKKDSGVRVPIDGRQRLTAIRDFFQGKVAIPDMPSVEEEYKKAKFKLQDGDEKKGYKLLALEDRERFEDYELTCVEYEGLDESIAMDIFVRLQGGKALTKNEVRAALGGKLCEFVTELTAGDMQHDFFKVLSKNVKDIRKAHRNIADLLLHEFFYPGEDKHWSSLEALYREKCKSLTPAQKEAFRDRLSTFLKATTIVAGKQKVLMPQLKSAHLIVSVFRAWNSLNDEYDVPKDAFSGAIKKFESRRVNNPDSANSLKFTSALSNAGYAKNRIATRHEILMEYLVNNIRDLKKKARDRKRIFTLDQKIEIWERAEHRCEHVDDGGARCRKKFPHPRGADADHIVMWSHNGPTTIANGRLLCQAHNRGRKAAKVASRRSA